MQHYIVIIVMFVLHYGIIRPIYLCPMFLHAIKLPVLCQCRGSYSNGRALDSNGIEVDLTQMSRVRTSLELIFP